MKRGGIIGWAALVSTAMCAPVLADASPSSDTQMKALREAYQQKDCKTVLDQGRRLRDGGSNAPAGNDLMWLNSAIVSCASYQDDKALMYRDALKATATDSSSIYVWRVRFSYQVNQKDYEAALATLETEAQAHAAALNDLPIEYLFHVHQLLDRAGDKARDIHLLKLLSTSYRPVQPFADVESMRLIYARKLYDSGDKAGAAALINAVQGFSGLSEIKADPDFSALQNPKVDLSLAAERQYVEDEVTLSQHPDSLQGIVQVADDLRRLGRYHDALAKLEGVRARIAIPKSFADQLSQQVWWWDDLAATYVALGDYEHMVESYRGAIAIGEMGQPNVSQVLNLAVEQIRFGYYQDALATLATAPQDPAKLSPYGAMVYHGARGCALALAGQKADAAMDIAYAATHEKDAPMNRGNLLLCIGDMDGAASLYVRLLNDSEKRSSVLSLFSDFRPGPPNVPEGPARSRLPAMKARADIQAALAKSGGVQSYPFPFDDM